MTGEMFPPGITPPPGSRPPPGSDYYTLPNGKPLCLEDNLD